VLAAAHEASLVHRDLKPSNVMLEADGGVKVLDFGLAVAPTLPDFSKITQSGQPLGTPGYMAPEQILAGVSGPHSDLYALGCTLFEMLAGEALFHATTSYSLMTQQVTEPPRPLRRVRPETPPRLERLVLSLLEKKPEDRPVSAHAVYEALLPFVTGLGLLPGALDPPATISPARMYAQVLGRVLTDVGAAPSSTKPSARQRARAPFDRAKLRASLAEARGLVRQSRHSQAAELLESTVDSAVAAFGATDPEVVSLRVELADTRFEVGDYRRAAPEYQQLARDVGDPNSRLALRCRLKEATCHALLGDAPHALTQLRTLVVDQTRVFGPDDPGTIDLRRQIALLQLGAGDQAGATQTLQRLKQDLSRLNGPTHPSVREVEELLRKLDGDLV
jgi:hypothetical protein